MSQPVRALAEHQLDDRYRQASGRIFLTGTQALVRAMLDQARRDRAAGLNTAGFVSGYRGSPLGSVDMELWRQRTALEASRIEFLPAVNEDLAATAILGTQQVENDPARTVEGVFSLWYGKGPGVDRSGDALKHGNAYGSSAKGGVLVVAGDDHGCVSSSMPHQSDAALLSWFMPVLNPANVGEYLTFAEYGYALSRFSGMWVGFKAISETVESASSVELHDDRDFVTPDFEAPVGGLHYRWPDLPGPQIEERLEAKKNAVFAFAKANPIDKRIYDVDDAKIGFVTTGKAHLDLMEALRLLGLGQEQCRELGIDVYKVGMVWPLAPDAALGFVRDKSEVVVVEEKRGIIESQLKEYFYDWEGDKPGLMVGKNDENGNRLIPWIGELSPRLLLPIIAARLDGVFGTDRFARQAAEILCRASVNLQVAGATRTPYFCSGCPHNTSTKVPEGSKALAGIGCHFMASWMDRETTSLIQMGGEGVNWAAASRFNGGQHIFQNLGEGTWYHSGSMAIRQAIAAGANITYKVLYNDAVAMTGGQPVDGPVSVQAIAAISRAEGVERIALVSDEPGKFVLKDFPAGITLHGREELDHVQRELRTVKGVSLLIYEQACATEKRRRRKRGTLEDPKRFAVINELVCEGCGDCSVESNCLSVEPVETEFGRKRQINQSNCNKDFSCLNGFCPSFVTVEGATRRKKEVTDAGIDWPALASGLPEPSLPALAKPFNLLVTGVGGTGVVTVGALITMAAHMEGKGASVLDFTGFAQKFGSVLSYIRLGASPTDIHQVRIDDASADAVIGCDIVVSSSPKASSTYRAGTAVVLNTAEMPTGDLVQHRDASLNVGDREQAIANVVGAASLRALDANKIAERILGNSVFANVIMLGYAWQLGLVPVGLGSLTRAIELNGVAIEHNHHAFLLGRALAEDPNMLSDKTANAKGASSDVDSLIDQRAEFLENYQDARWADRFRAQIANVSEASAAVPDKRNALITAATKSLFKLMSYKDEYEVARLHSEPSFKEKLKAEYEGNYKVKYHLAPPLLSGKKDARGRPRKREFGFGMRTGFALLSRLKGLRGGAFDLFGYTAERRMERELIGWFEELLHRFCEEITPENSAEWLAILEAPMEIRGYGPVKEAAQAATRTEVENRLRTLNA